MKFSKMHGNGNDFIVIEDLNNEYLGKEGEIAQKCAIEDLELVQMGF